MISTVLIHVARWATCTPTLGTAARAGPTAGAPPSCWPRSRRRPKQLYCSQTKIFCADCVRGKYRKYQPGELWSQKIPSAEKMDWKLRKMFRLLFRCLWAVLSSVPHHHVKYTSGESHFWSFDIKCWNRGHQDPGDIRLNRISFGLRTKGAERLTEGRQNGRCTYNLSYNCSQTDSIRYNIYSIEARYNIYSIEAI